MGALLFLGVEVFPQRDQALLQVFDRRLDRTRGVVLLQALFALLQQHPGLFDRFVGLLQALPQRADLGVVDGQQALQPSVVELRMLGAPVGDLAVQGVPFLLQRLLTGGVGLEFAGQLHVLGTQRLKLLRRLAVECPGLFELRVAMLLPGFGAGLLAKQFGQLGVRLLTLGIERCALLWAWVWW